MIFAAYLRGGFPPDEASACLSQKPRSIYHNCNDSYSCWPKLQLRLVQSESENAGHANGVSDDEWMRQSRKGTDELTGWQGSMEWDGDAMYGAWPRPEAAPLMRTVLNAI